MNYSEKMLEKREHFPNNYLTKHVRFLGNGGFAYHEMSRAT